MLLTIIVGRDVPCYVERQCLWGRSQRDIDTTLVGDAVDGDIAIGQGDHVAALAVSRGLVCQSQERQAQRSDGHHVHDRFQSRVKVSSNGYGRAWSNNERRSWMAGRCQTPRKNEG